MSDFKHDLLEQKVQVMQNEVSQVLGEMQTTIQAIAQTYSTALKVILERLDALESRTKVLEAKADKMYVGSEETTKE